MSSTTDEILNTRVLVFSVSLGMSFGILVLFVSSLAAISLVVVLITATIVAASTADLTTVKQERNLPLIMVTTAAIVFVGVSLYSRSFGQYVFYELFGVNLVILLGYIALRIAARVNRGQAGR